MLEGWTSIVRVSRRSGWTRNSAAFQQELGALKGPLWVFYAP